jgi:hypothetical protein
MELGQINFIYLDQDCEVLSVYNRICQKNRVRRSLNCTKQHDFFYKFLSNIATQGSISFFVDKIETVSSLIGPKSLQEALPFSLLGA